MALIYSIRIADNMSVLDAKKILATLPDFKEENGGITMSDGLLVYITQSSGLSIGMIEDDFGFTPKLHISFRLVGSRTKDLVVIDVQGLAKLFMQVFWLIIKETKGDAVVLSNGEQIIIQRKKGKLYLNNIDNFWFESILPKGQQYEMKTLKRPWE